VAPGGGERRARALRHALEERLGERLRERCSRRQLRRDDERPSVLLRGRGGREASLEIREKTRDGRRRDARHRRQSFRQEYRVKRGSRAGRALREEKTRRRGNEGESAGGILRVEERRATSETAIRERERAGFGNR